MSTNNILNAPIPFQPSKGGLGVTTTPANGQIPIGNGTNYTIVNITAGSNLTITNGAGTITIVSNMPINYISNLSLTWASLTTITLATGQCRNSTNTFDIIVTGSQTITVSSTGVNGLDAGAVAASTWYAVFSIGDTTGSNTGKGLLSLSSTSPTLPVGYNVFRRIGWIKTTAASQILNFYQQGADGVRIYFWNDLLSTLSVLSSGSATTFTSVSCSAFIPSTANYGTFTVGFTNQPAGASATDNAKFRATGSSLTTANTPYLVSLGTKTSGGASNKTQISLPLSASQSIDYAVTNANDTLTLTVVGYYDYV
jgi:hypothetical protein